MTTPDEVLAAFRKVTGWTDAEVLHYAVCESTCTPICGHEEDVCPEGRAAHEKTNEVAEPTTPETCITTEHFTFPRPVATEAWWLPGCVKVPVCAECWNKASDFQLADFETNMEGEITRVTAVVLTRYPPGA